MAKAQYKDSGGILAALQAFFCALDNDRAGAEKKIVEAVELGQGFGHYHHTTLIFAYTYAALHEPALAMKWLDYTADHGFPNLPWFERDPNLDALRDEPAFVAFLERLKPGFLRLRELAAT